MTTETYAALLLDCCIIAHTDMDITIHGVQVSLNVKEATLSLDFEGEGRIAGAIPALRLRLEQVTARACANQRCLNANFGLGVMEAYGVVDVSDAAGNRASKAPTALLRAVEGQGERFLTINVQVLNSGAREGDERKETKPDIGVKGRIRKLEIKLPPDAVTNGCRWLTRASAAVLQQPVLAAATRDALSSSMPSSPIHSSVTAGEIGAGEAKTVPKTDLHDEKHGDPGMVLVVDVETEGVDLTLYTTAGGGSAVGSSGEKGIGIAVGTIRVGVRADVRSQTEAPEGELVVDFVRCTMVRDVATLFLLFRMLCRRNFTPDNLNLNQPYVNAARRSLVCLCRNVPSPCLDAVTRSQSHLMQRNML